MPNLSNTVTFLFAGDGSLASDGLSMFLQTKSNFLMVAECSDGASAIADIQAHSPAIAVIDAQLPDMTASQIIEAVRTGNRETKIIVLGASADRNVADRMLAAGADAYIVRSDPSRHLNEAIRYVRDDGKYLAPELTRDLPVPADNHCTALNGEACSSLRDAVEVQARTVERLEQAMDRAQYAIELLQQKVEQLSGAPLAQAASPQAAEDAGRSRMRPGFRTGMGAVVATLMAGFLFFMLGGVLKPGPASSATYSTGSLPGTGMETEPIDNASALLRNRQYVAAEKLCRTMLKHDPANIMASRVLASALFHQDRIEESADVVRSMAVPAPRTDRTPAARRSLDSLAGFHN